VPAIVSKIAQQPHRFIAITGICILFLTIPLSVIVVVGTLGRVGTQSKAAFAPPPFTITGVFPIAKEIDTDGNNATQNVDVCGADLGSMFDWNGKVYNVFGDTFGCPLNPYQPNWRSNTLAVSSDTNPSDGITFSNWITGADGKAKELIPNDPVSSTETAIPTYGISIGTTGYLFYFEGQISPTWTCSYSSVAKSTDGGQNWTRLTGLKWAPGNFNQVAIYRPAGSSYIYFFGIPCGRAGGAKMMRVLEGSIENKAAYEYLTGYDASGGPIWTVNAESLAITVVSAPVGELSVRWNDYLKQYIMMYLKDVAPFTIELRSASSIWGPWSSPQTVTTGDSYACIYAPYMKEGYEENMGQTVYFRLSRFCPGFNPYSTYWMKMTLSPMMASGSPSVLPSNAPVVYATPSPTPIGCGANGTCVTNGGGNLDSDNDGFSDAIEQYIGTNPYLACGVNAWPPDFNNDGKVNGADYQMLSQHSGSSLGQTKYSVRFDLNVDGKIDIKDYFVWKNYNGKKC